jgi:RNA polymerase sigma factor for flagellar operon FliA
MALRPPLGPTSAAVTELVEQNLPLVGHLVREILAKVPAHVRRDDLTSAAMMALTLAAQGFDAERGVPFARYAAIRIRGALVDELRGMDWAARSVRTARALERRCSSSCCRMMSARASTGASTRAACAARSGCPPTTSSSVDGGELIGTFKFAAPAAAMAGSARGEIPSA